MHMYIYMHAETQNPEGKGRVLGLVGGSGLGRLRLQRLSGLGFLGGLGFRA